MAASATVRRICLSVVCATSEDDQVMVTPTLITSFLSSLVLLCFPSSFSPFGHLSAFSSAIIYFTLSSQVLFAAAWCHLRTSLHKDTVPTRTIPPVRRKVYSYSFALARGRGSQHAGNVCGEVVMQVEVFALELLGKSGRKLQLRRKMLKLRRSFRARKEEGDMKRMGMPSSIGSTRCALYGKVCLTWSLFMEVDISSSQV